MQFKKLRERERERERERQRDRKRYIVDFKLSKINKNIVFKLITPFIPVIHSKIISS